MDEKKRYRHYYEWRALADEYFTKDKSILQYGKLERWKKLELVFKFLKDTFEGVVVDVGCGEGYFCCEMAKFRPELEVIGIDISRNRLKKASEFSRELLPFDAKTHFILGDAEYLPLTSDIAACTILIEILEHLPEPIRSLFEIKRILRYGAFALILVPNSKPLISFRFRLRRFFNRFGFSSGEVNRFGLLPSEVKNNLVRNLPGKADEHLWNFDYFSLKRLIKPANFRAINFMKMDLLDESRGQFVFRAVNKLLRSFPLLASAFGHRLLVLCVK